MQEVQPTVLYSVPALFNRINDGVNNKVANSPKHVQRLFAMAMQLKKKERDAEAAKQQLGLFDRLSLAALDVLVLAKIRAQFGGQLYVLCCSADA